MSRALVLEEPSLVRRDSYLGLLREFRERGEPLVPFTLSFPPDDFPAFLERLAACARGEGIPEGFVAHSTFWLVRGHEVVGVSNLRHALTEKLRIEGGNIGYGIRPSARRQGLATSLLALTLAPARALGLREVLLTCSKDNRGSVRTILRNGGVLASEAFIAERGEIVQRYTIDLTTTPEPGAAEVRQDTNAATRA